jgi:hypothetical protein
MKIEMPITFEMENFDLWQEKFAEFGEKISELSKILDELNKIEIGIKLIKGNFNAQGK